MTRQIKPPLLDSAYRTPCQSRPNRFAAEALKGGFVVLVDEDIAEVFQTPESIKNVLRALIATMPTRTGPKTTARRARS